MLKKLLNKLIGSKKGRRRAGKSRKGGASRTKKSPAKRKPSAKKGRPVRAKGAASVQAKRRKQLPPEKPGPPPGAGPEIGRVIAFFRIPVVAVLKITKGRLKVGERIWIKGHTTDMKHTVASMQINHQPVQEIGKGDEAGVKVSSRARRGDRVYRLP